jgi:hypothetical protein
MTLFLSRMIPSFINPKGSIRIVAPEAPVAAIENTPCTPTCRCQLGVNERIGDYASIDGQAGTTIHKWSG